VKSHERKNPKRKKELKMAEKFGSCIGALLILTIAIVAIILGLNAISAGMAWVSPLCFGVAIVLVYFAAVASPIKKD